jgi:hypothetical protein
VQISTAYGQQQKGSATLPRNKYTEIRQEKPTTKEEAVRPEFKTCKYTTEAIVSDGIDKGEIRKVCTEANCPVHHPKKRPQQIADDAKRKAEQEKQRKETAIANTTGIRILAAITAAVPVRLMKRDLHFVVERLASLLDENRLAVVARQHGIKKAKDIRLSQLQDQGKLADEHASLAKAFCTVKMRETVGYARELLGANGILLDYNIGRFVADAEAIYSYEGTREMNTLIVGRAVSGFSAFI